MTNSSDIYFPSDIAEGHFIKSIWRLQEYNAIQRTETILPKGTVEIIFNLSEKITYLNSYFNSKAILPSCFINGINFKPFNLIKSGQQIFLGVQLSTAGLKVLLNVTVKEFNDNVVEGSLVCKSLDELWQQLFPDKTFEEQVDVIRQWLFHKLTTSKYASEINYAQSLLFHHRLTGLKVKELCNDIRISERQLRRISAEWLGMNTETFLLYNKYLFALNLLHRPGISLTQIGLEAGYYDQSHFIREFKSFTNLTPKEYQASTTTIPGHIIR